MLEPCPAVAEHGLLGVLGDEPHPALTSMTHESNHALLLAVTLPHLRTESCKCFHLKILH